MQFGKGRLQLKQGTWIPIRRDKVTGIPLIDYELQPTPSRGAIALVARVVQPPRPHIADRLDQPRGPPPRNSLRRQDRRQDRLAIQRAMIWHQRFAHASPDRLAKSLQGLHISFRYKHLEEAYSQCKGCAAHKGSVHLPPRAGDKTLQVSKDFSDLVSTDIMFIKGHTNGVMVNMSNPTRYIKTEFVKNTDATTSDAAFKSSWTSRFGTPKAWRADRDRGFNKIEETLRADGCRVERTPPYSSFSDARNERVRSTLLNIVRSIFDAHTKEILG